MSALCVVAKGLGGEQKVGKNRRREEDQGRGWESGGWRRHNTPASMPMRNRGKREKGCHEAVMLANRNPIDLHF